jgi:hypothetical protein
MGFGLVSERRPQLPPELSREEFLAEVRQGHVHDMTIWDKQVINGVSSTRGPFRTDLHADAQNRTRELRVMNIQVFRKESRDSSPGPLF